MLTQNDCHTSLQRLMYFSDTNLVLLTYYYSRIVYIMRMYVLRINCAYCMHCIYGTLYINCIYCIYSRVVYISSDAVYW